MSQEQLIILNRMRERWQKDPKAFAQDEPLLALAFKDATETLKAKQDLATVQQELSGEREHNRRLGTEVPQLRERIQELTARCFDLEERLEQAYLTREDLAQLRTLIEYRRPGKPKPRKQFQPGEKEVLAGLGWSKNARA